MPKKSNKTRKPITCPVCKVKFSYTAKKAPIARLSQHIAKKHPSYKRKKSKKQQTNKGQLLDEMQLFDDFVANRMMSPGVMSQTTEHQQIAGTIISAIKLGYALAQAGTKIVKTIKKRKSK